VADPEDVWPCLAQLGQGRGGLYSRQRIENLFGCRIENADRVIPEMQDVRVGDEVRLVPPDYRADLSFEVVVAEPNRALVLRGKGTREEALAKGMAFPDVGVRDRADGGRPRPPPGSLAQRLRAEAGTVPHVACRRAGALRHGAPDAEGDQGAVRAPGA